VSETTQIIIGLCVLIIVYILTRKFHAWKIRKTYLSIVKDLEQKGALDPTLAIELPYAKQAVFRFGTRDYRPKALEYLIASNIVGVTDNGQYYLKKKTPLNGLN